MDIQILNIGKPLSKAEQQTISGGGRGTCSIRLNGSVWHGLSLSSIDQAISKMDEGDSLQWCCDSCSTASWIND